MGLGCMEVDRARVLEQRNCGGGLEALICGCFNVHIRLSLCNATCVQIYIPLAPCGSHHKSLICFLAQCFRHRETLEVNAIHHRASKPVLCDSQSQQPEVYTGDVCVNGPQIVNGSRH